MLLLTATTDKLQVLTDSALDMDVHVSFMDNSAGTVTPGRQNTLVTTAATVDILASPGAGVQRNVRFMSLRLRDVSIESNVTVFYNANGTTYSLFKATLSSGDVIQFIEGTGFFVTERHVPLVFTSSTSDQVASAADTYLVGSGIAIPTNRPMRVGTTFRWHMTATKTAAGTATPVWSLRVGTAGTTADTARATITGNTQSAASDTATLVVDAIVRGPIGASGVIHVSYELHHQLATTGFSTLNHNVVQGLSSAFDITTAGLIVGLSVNPGAAGVWTFQQVISEAMGI